MLRELVKLWPAFLPIAIYLLWVLLKHLGRKKVLQKTGKIIDGVFSEVKKDEAPNEEEIGDFSFRNQRFVTALYLSFFTAIICFLFFALRVPRVVEGEYVPAHIENGKVIPAKIIEKK